MMQAKVQLTLEVEEFDLVRRALATFVHDRRERSNDSESTPGSRRAAKVEFDEAVRMFETLGMKP